MTQQPWQPPPPKPKLPLFLGILIGLVAPYTGLVVSTALARVDGFSWAAELTPLASLVWVMVVLFTGAALLFSDHTRRWGVGILIGLFGTLIIGAGACVTLLIVFLASYDGG